jgi:replicative superfamily II helicase
MLCVAMLMAYLLPAVSYGAQDLPEWVTSPPIDTVSSMYGVGEGKDRESAKSAALAAIAGTMMTKVQGSTLVNQRQDQDGFAEQVEQTVKTKVREVALSHYQVIEAERLRGRWWVLV